MATWAIAVNILFPVPFFCLLLLCLPLPKSYSSFIRKYVIGLVDKVLFTDIAGGMNLYRISTILSALLFLASSWETTRAASKLATSRDFDHLSMKEEKLLCNKWRAERNFWISLFSLVLWLILFRVYTMTKELEVVKADLKEKSK
jgi:hypothetical protein